MAMEVLPPEWHYLPKKSREKDHSGKFSRKRSTSKYYRNQKYGHFKSNDFYKKGNKSKRHHKDSGKRNKSTCKASNKGTCFNCGKKVILGVSVGLRPKPSLTAYLVTKLVKKKYSNYQNSTPRVTNPVVLVTMKSTNLTNFPRYGSVAPIMTLPSKTSREEYQVL